MPLRRLAAASAGLTLILIVAGGLVTNTDSGLACPDWPMCFGSPLPRMVGGVAVEHTHRLIASAVGLCAVLLALFTLRREGQGRLAALLLGIFMPLVLGAAFGAGFIQHRTGTLPIAPGLLVLAGFVGCAAVFAAARGPARLATLALTLVLAQGLLGGLTVIFQLPPTVLVLHLATSMLVFSTFLVLTLQLGAPSPGPASVRPGRPGLGLFSLTTAAVYLQMILGATVRHTGAGLICTDLPFCRGAVWPLHVHPAVHLHMTHRAFAFVVAALVLASSARILRANAATGALRALAWASPALVLVQIVLGVLTITTYKDLVPTTGHLLVAALLLGAQVAQLVVARNAGFEPSVDARPHLAPVATGTARTAA